MVSKDQAIGGVIFLVCIIVALRSDIILPAMARQSNRRRHCSDTVLAGSHPGIPSVRRRIGHRRMDWMDNGNHAPTETHRRNRTWRKHRKGRKNRGRTKKEAV